MYYPGILRDSLLLANLILCSFFMIYSSDGNQHDFNVCSSLDEHDHSNELQQEERNTSKCDETAVASEGD